MAATHGRWRNRLGACAGAALVIAASGTVLPEFVTMQATNWALYGLLALSLVLVWGHAGIFSFGQGAFFGAGAYAYGIAAINLMPYTNETFSAVLIGVLAGAILAAVVGYFMFYGKVGDVYVGIITLAMTLVFFTVISSTADPKYRVGKALLGGYNGMAGVPTLTWPTADGGEPLSVIQVFIIVIALCATILAALYLTLEKPFGRVLAALRENELRTQLLGFDVRLRKLLVFSLGGGIAGMAGALYAAWAMFISPSVFDLHLAAMVVIWVLVGGRTSLTGAFVGACLVQALSSTLGGSAGNATPIVLGAVLIAIVLFLPQGIVPMLQRWAGRRPFLKTPLSTDAFVDKSPASFDSLPVQLSGIKAALDTRELTKHFGGVKAVQQASMAFGQRGIHALIGPNGAGKSTFFNLLVGRFPPTSGQILLGDQDITKLEPHERATLGMGIKLQIASIFTMLSVHENLWLAAYGRLRDRHAADQRAREMVSWLGLAHRAHEPAGTLSHGQKQWLEIAMVIASEPAIVLLDEPAAGMTNEETSRLAGLVRWLGSQTTVIVVEHDMEFVRSLEAPITVFHQGGIFASGSIEELRRDERILDIYLGRHESEAA